MEWKKAVVTLLLTTSLSGCFLTPYVKRLEPYAVPVTEEAWQVCVIAPDLPYPSSFQDIAKNKILADKLRDECIAKHKYLKSVLETLENEQIIRIITPEGKRSGPTTEEAS